ncbi:MAG: YicC family protein [Lachnospiraceae bacterium]|nr:YicC family protein [Lachnospiraceae bacterium]
MAKSMTGFGRGECSDDFRKITVELRSVNHRYLDVNVKMPRNLNFLETFVRSALKNSVSRGKVDVFLSYEDLSNHDVNVKYNRELATEYLSLLREMAEDFSLEDDIRTSTLSRYPEVLTMEDVSLDEKEIKALIEKALQQALEQFVEARTVEGEKLRGDLEEKLQNMLKNVDLVEERGPQIVAEYREKLEQKVRELLDNVQIDEGRLTSEIVLFADKICTDEETVRLRTHIYSMIDTLKEENEVGRKLDFIAQEMNREANTILSKANDMETSNIAIELKTEIEKVREQIQNLE